MESTIVKAVSFFLDQSEENLVDRDHWIVNYVVKAIDSFTKVCKIATAHRAKSYTESKREEVATELAKIIYLSACLSHLCDLEPSVFEAESLTDFSRNFEPDYQQDTILCAMIGMRALMDISEELYVTNYVEGEALLGEEPGKVPDAPGPDEEDENPIEQSIAEIFSCIIIICEHLDLDLETVMANSVLVFKKP